MIGNSLDWSNKKSLLTISYSFSWNWSSWVMKESERLKRCGLFLIHHQRSRYIFDLFYKRKAISRGKYLIPYFVNLKLPMDFNLNKYYAFLFRIVRLLLKRTYRRFQSHRKMEKARIRELVLPQVHSNKRHKFWYKLHLPGAQS